ncbi:NTP pyrophosphatase (non-canonical NTP hydrolase) [Staphylococcus hominis]
MAKVKLSMEEWHNVVKSLNKLLHLLYDALKERDSLRKQRDELIQDIAKLRNGEIKMTNTLDQLVKQVETWSVDKNLHNGNPDRQALKFYEEAGEVAAALSRGQVDALKDGIGDTVVTLIILAQQHDMTLQECLQYAYDEIKGRKGKTINGTFIKEADLKE